MLDKLIAAVYREDKAAINKIIMSGVDINVRDEDGRTALMHAVLAEEADVDFIESLISLGADVNASDRDQEWTAMHFTARDQRFELIKALINNGAHIDPIDIFGNTPLWRCVMSASPNQEIANLLLKNGADPNKKNDRGTSPRDVVMKLNNQDVLKILDEDINK